MPSVMRSNIDSVITKTGTKVLEGESRRRSQRGTSRRRKGRKTCNPTQFLTAFSTVATVQEDVLRLFESHLRQSPTFFAFFKEENKAKNNFPHVLLYDHSRVKLKDNNGGNYYHAAFVDGFYHPRQYICAQMPFSTETQADLFRMMLQIRPKTVICMGKIDREANLFPVKKDGTKTGGRVSIKCTSATSDSKVDHYSYLFVCGRKKFHFKVFCFNAWQEETKIPSPEDILEFHATVRKAVPQKKKCHSGRTLVICPNGASRSGLFVVLDKELERLKTEGRMRYGLSVRGCRYRVCNSFDRFELFEAGIKCLTIRAKEYVKEHKGKGK
ncbi:hypothetical protein QR680_004383 [Steinernema hermaphroditum]|uniref:Tyrosine-protein phosphatase domain-containing protein n=1 Tax=Steinernema hermaphroditum TaxID=289476 RepID=A0AA39LTX2_9BILA|nr:hypothetical protein QR680_004383 [Steinernema hermaphroditum]